MFLLHPEMFRKFNMLALLNYFTILLALFEIGRYLESGESQMLTLTYQQQEIDFVLCVVSLWTSTSNSLRIRYSYQVSDII